MPIPTELVGSLPRPLRLQEAHQALDQGDIPFADLQREQDAAAGDSIRRLEGTGETYVSDGEQRESSFATYPITTTSPAPVWPNISLATASSSPSSTMAITANCRAWQAGRSATIDLKRLMARRTSRGTLPSRKSRPVSQAPGWHRRRSGYQADKLAGRRLIA